MAGVRIGFEVTDKSALACLRRLERNLSAEGIVAAGRLVLKELELYHGRTWGHNVQGNPDTRKRWPNSSTLYNTGALKVSMTSRGPHSIRVATPFEIVYGTSVYYANFVDKGTVNQSPKPFLKFNTTVYRLISKTVTKAIMMGVG